MPMMRSHQILIL